MERRNNVASGDFWWRTTEELPKDWTESAFHGNGVLGSMVYFTEREGSYFLHVELGSNEVYDRRKTRDFWMAKQFDNPRLPIGYLEYPMGRLYGEGNGPAEYEMHTDIYRGRTDLVLRNVPAKKGGCEEVSCRFYVCAEQPVIVIEQKKGDIGNWKFTPREAVSPRQTFGLERQEEFRIDPSYQKNPSPKIWEKKAKDGRLQETGSVQYLEEDYRTITICRYDEERSALFVTIAQDKNLEVEKVRSTLEAALCTEYQKCHQEWWEHYFQISGIEIPDQTLEAFYWRQIYKLGSAVRRKSRVLDNQGPWLSTTPWPGTWWNLNVQLCYWPLYTSGRLEQADSLNRYLEKYQENLIQNVAPKYRHDSSGIGTNSTWNLRSKIADPLEDNGLQFVELGNLTWALHDCWLYYRMTMDQGMLRDFLYPLLRRSINYYLHFVKKGEDGKWHLPFTDSPEYGERCEDCNYDLSLLRWGCKTLLEAAEVLKITDEKEEMWREICENLTDYPVDENGYLIGRNLPYAKSHRHFSHLMMHMPLYLVNRDNSDCWELLEKSICHWFSYKGDILGFSYVGASLMYSAYRKGTKALEHIRQLLKNHITRNSMYREAGPVMETPLAAAECIQQLLLQSWGNKIRIFPAVPEGWESASFDHFAAQGGFRVSAVYENHRTVKIELESLAGEPCILETDMKQARIRYQNGNTEIRNMEMDSEIRLAAGEKVLLTSY